MYDSADLIPVSALQHYLYCPRQCALIYLEQAWTENLYTAEGKLLHEKAHQTGKETRGDTKTVSALWVRSKELGLSGQADMVEFHLQNSVWHPYPVEYKRGRPKQNDADRVQLCAQALCLEEMLGLAIPEGSLFYGKPRRRQVVALDDRLRELTRRVALAVHELLQAGVTPPPPDDTETLCPACSLQEHCLPTSCKRSALRYMSDLLEQS